MIKQSARVERLFNKFQFRYGSDDDLVRELQAEISKHKQNEELHEKWMLRASQPKDAHDEHKASSALRKVKH
ncbi:hypothetical protein [Acidovorax carolinensis]|uniref:hypothetical protein n=1 Tax=Acidovorax carolinensis TaxID=553814 RepID=UPI0012FFAC9E|nr:hypothetical protein [Acidovorax carolinensis]